MADQDEYTSDQEVQDETSNSEEATQSEEQSEESDTVTLAREDYKKLISQRDKNFSEQRDALAEVDELRAIQARDKFIDAFIADNKEKYPWVDKEDLEAAETPEEVEAIARRVQKKAEQIAQKERENIENIETPPPLSEKAKQQRLAELEKRANEGDPKAFEEMLELEGIGTI